MNSKQKNFFLFFMTAVIIFITVLNLKHSAKLQNRTFLEYFDTAADITVFAKNDKSIKACEGYMKKMNNELSADSSNGLIYRYNKGEAVDFSDDTNELIAFAKEFSEENGEYFSVYLDPVIKKWDIKNNEGYIPDISEALSCCKKKNTLNLGGIAKGFVTQKLVDILEENNISSALINLGGNAYALGKKPTGESWHIGIKSPKNDDSIIGIISAENLAVITSGDYERFFDLDGVRYHHILNPQTGFPANTGLHSVTVISDNPTLCDALSTAAFVAGLEKGWELLKKYNCMGIFISDDTVYFSKSLENIFKQTDFSYKYEFLF